MHNQMIFQVIQSLRSQLDLLESVIVGNTAAQPPYPQSYTQPQEPRYSNPEPQHQKLQEQVYSAQQEYRPRAEQLQKQALDFANTQPEVAGNDSILQQQLDQMRQP